MKRILAASCLALAAASAHASDADPGVALSKPCAACHGADGATSISPDIPKLAGQHYDYLLKAIRDYKSGARKNAIMAPQVANLSPRDIEELAAYFSRQKGLVTRY